ncbi:MAG: 4-(cytidine 5'-diphospho)-2-C-methyl-D-erythritol kinase [bacterium]|nr:4-(cytidine 5'-diphospho)-2-C-methyl-D-erythritol kinase [bacterium]
MIAGNAYAKVNLGLRVGSLGEDGFHQLAGIFQSVDIADSLEIEAAETDSIRTCSGAPVVDGLDNLAFKAVAAVRSRAGSAQPIAITLDKSIPTAAGLGGGSADAAAALAFAGRYFGVDQATLRELAPTLGSDVPFCLVGGSARVGGRGDRIERLDPLMGFALAIVVPPVEVSTPVVFGEWDQLGGPRGLAMAEKDLPPALRGDGDLVNDLYPATVAVASIVDEWRTELEGGWGRPVMMSGSGPSLYAFFLDRDEAASAVVSVPVGSRFAEACDPASVGWTITSSQ